MAKTYLYVGNWHDKRGAGKKIPPMDAGIAICEFDSENGKIKHIENNVSGEFFGVGKCYIDNIHNVLYATDERENYPGLKNTGGGSRVLAFAIDTGTGKLTKLNEMPTFGTKASYVTGDGTGRYVLVTNHGDRVSTTITERDAFGKYHLKVQHDESNVVLFPVNKDGSLGKPKDIFRLKGDGPKHFQHGPHAHCVVKAPDKNLYAVCDKGGDQVYMLKIDYESETIVPCQVKPFHHIPGAACRYCDFHPTKPYLYVDNEAITNIISFEYDNAGNLSVIESINSKPPELADPPEEALCQTAIVVDVKGEHLYVAARVINTICVYDIDQNSGKLTHKQTVLCSEGGVRMLCPSPDGKFMLASYPYDNKVEVYSVCDDGKLGEITDVFIQPTPATLNFFQE